MKLQCISTKSGFYKYLRLFEWYEIEIPRSYEDNNYIYIEHMIIENGVSMSYRQPYDRSLFRSKDEIREKKLNSILNV